MTDPDDLKTRVREFWSANPMAYGTSSAAELNDEAFLAACHEIDDVYYGKLAGQVNAPGEPPYANLVDYARYRGRPALEVGFGAGSLLKALGGQGLDVHGIDLSDSHEAWCKRRIALGDFAAGVQQGDAEDLPFDDSSFDLVISHGVLHHTPNTQRCFEELLRVLKPGGQLVTMLYHRDSFRVRYVYYFALMPHRFRHPKKRVFCSLNQAIDWATDIHDPEQLGSPLNQAFTRRDVERFCDGFSSVAHMTWDYPEMLRYLPPLAVMPRAWKRAFLGRYGYFLVTSAFK